MPRPIIKKCHYRVFKLRYFVTGKHFLSLSKYCLDMVLKPQLPVFLFIPVDSSGQASHRCLLTMPYSW